MDPRVHLFGIRHHGPGSAASLVAALDALDPEEIVVEGPPEGTALLRFVTEGLVPPVALLVHSAEDPARAVFYPFAAWSPEWQAVRWALARGRRVGFADLAVAHLLAPAEPAEPDPEAPEPAEAPARTDPIGALAAAAGYDDGEAWWSALVEEGAAAPELFAHIELAMSTVRAAHPTPPGPAAEREDRREAAMRLGVREALERTTGPVAVVVGAWHVPALRSDVPAKDDRALLRGLPREKVVATWVPWSDTRLAAGSGYGAGVSAPGWYRTLWETWIASGGAPAPRALATRWQVAVAHALRAERLLASTGEVIDAVRLSEALAAMRERAMPGLSELRDASQAVLCQGDALRWRVVERTLLVGARVGEVPPDVPQMPLAADLARWQKRLRMVPEAIERELSLDLRTGAGAEKSVLLHRLVRLAVPWGALRDAGASRGTFRERWTLRWEPELSVRLAEALRWGTTVEGAAAGRTLHELGETTGLAALAALVQGALHADLPTASSAGIARLQEVAALGSDVAGLLGAVPPLVDVLRYGTARTLDTSELADLVRGMAERVHVGLPLAVRGLDAEAAATLRGLLIAYDRALAVLDEGAAVPALDAALTQVADDDEAAPVLQGHAARRLHDRGTWTDAHVATRLQASLSPGVPMAASAGWLEGFLGEAAHVLLHDTRLLGMVDDWLAGLGDDALTEALPLLRRATGDFGPHERQALLGAVAGERGPGDLENAGDVDLGAFHEGEALLDLILGISS